MKKIFTFLITAILALLFTACTDSRVIVAPDERAALPIETESSDERIQIPEDEFNNTVQAIPFIWQSSREITPHMVDDVDLSNLTEAFFDMTSGNSGEMIYVLQTESEVYRYYRVENGGALFLFELEGDRIDYRDFDSDCVGNEILTVAHVYDGSNLIGRDVTISQYLHGILKQSSLRELFDFDWVDIENRFYRVSSFNPAFSEPILKTAYVFDPDTMSFYEAVQDEPDRLGSWSSIGVSLERPDDWQKVVSDSKFQIGEKYLRGYWNMQNGQEAYYGRQFGDYPNIDGSSVCVPLAMEFVRQHLGMTDEGAREFVSFNKTPNAYRALIMRINYGSGLYTDGDERQLLDDNHPVDLILATYPSDNELSIAEQYNEPLIIEPICSDAFVFIVNIANPIDSLTMEQFRGIYNGKITNWSELGGNNEPIVAFQREPDSGSQTGMEQLVMKGEPLATAPAALVVQSMEGLIETVAEYDNGKASIG
ncbi:MAG: substrate-binding domain-containing protein, partial [Oscillospiraceae bacterium]|nr:substrate-binding domain-containing protein [Oscillospiraceae bacterium]